MRFSALLILLVLIGCTTTPAPRPIVHFPPNPAMQFAQRAVHITAPEAVIQPPKLRGCAWDYSSNELAGITFEVWASTNLVNWALATNTTAQLALFPEKAMEFYKVRARDEIGQVSDWATVAD